jgi:hypothetical protein
LKPLFEMPALLTLDGDPFIDGFFVDANPGTACSGGCVGGCCSGCEPGSGKGVPMKPPVG